MRGLVNFEFMKVITSRGKKGKGTEQIAKYNYIFEVFHQK